jgi:hypothetical protein
MNLKLRGPYKPLSNYSCQTLDMYIYIATGQQRLQNIHT